MRIDLDKYDGVWKSHIFSTGDWALFLPPESHKDIWGDHSELRGQACVVIRRQPGYHTTGIDDEYDVMFNLEGVGYLVPEVPQVWLKSFGRA
jgi:hypothetical protein